MTAIASPPLPSLRRRPLQGRSMVAMLLAVCTHRTVAAGSGTCGVLPGCLANHAHLLATTAVTTAADCCEACTRNIRCAAWTKWIPHNATPSPLCNMFSNSNGNIMHNVNNCSSGLASADRPARPNFVFSFPDTLRAESFNGYGVPLDVTPNLARFAETGTRFEQAHVMHTQCSPSRCTMFTGRCVCFMLCALVCGYMCSPGCTCALCAN